MPVKQSLKQVEEGGKQTQMNKIKPTVNITSKKEGPTTHIHCWRGKQEGGAKDYVLA